MSGTEGCFRLVWLKIVKMKQFSYKFPNLLHKLHNKTILYSFVHAVLTL